MNNYPKNLVIGGFTLKIINYLSKRPLENFTINSIHKLFRGSNYATIYRKIEQLVKEEILIKTMYGSSSQIKINLQNDNTISLLSFIEVERFKEFYKILNGNLKITLNEIVKDVRDILEIKEVLIFGSFAKGKQKKDSDIDLLVVYYKSNLVKNLEYDDQIKKSMMGILKTSELRGGHKINPIIVSVEEHKEMVLNKENNVGKETLLNHIILKGNEDYWRGIGNAIKEKS